MKLVALSAIAVLACACASTVQPISIASNPTDPQVDWNERLAADQQLTAEQQVAQEKRTYEASVAKINASFSDEELRLEMCAEVHGDPSTYCFVFLNKLCEEDVVLDSRSGHHVKEYCSKSYLDYHNPALHHQK